MSAILDAFKVKAQNAKIAELEAVAIASAYEKLLRDSHTRIARETLLTKYKASSGFIEIKGTAHDGIYEFFVYGDYFCRLDENLNTWVYLSIVKFTKAGTRQKLSNTIGLSLDFIVKNGVKIDLPLPKSKLVKSKAVSA